eukprot:Cvel_13187.t1-p1 / transcript=Cvel_13187.t1 / gene=Cvel_13187 / organism=Chromera_velia_CCMP2878 / gene_product=hypothetical protein / transcript_product=hypothetical protein / location=Cvel_scaffold891:42179-43048(+) / protein_length=290 / sequence_SO=supercontig / SO=protein_coding / is_pseudo=false
MAALGVALGCGGCLSLQEIDLDWGEEGDEGVGGLAQGLGGGGLPSLRDLSLNVVCRQDMEGGWDGQGCVALGDVLSTGKIPALRTVSLKMSWDRSFASVCECLSRGRIDPPIMVNISVGKLADTGVGVTRFAHADAGVTSFAEIIRAGKLSGLRNFTCREFQVFSRFCWEKIGEAISHAEASLRSLEELDLSDPMSAFLQGLSRGQGSLPALQSLKCRYSSIGTEGAQSLSALVRGGRVPSLRDLEVELTQIGQDGMQALAAALQCPHASALRQLDLTSFRLPPQMLQLK